MENIPLSAEQLRLLTKVALLYHQQGLKQSEISAKLHMAQAKVSRLLTQAQEVGIVRTTVVPPLGVHVDLEQQLEARYGLSEVVIADAIDDSFLTTALGSAAARYLETTLIGGEHLGISSWSTTLLATVESMNVRNRQVAAQVIQLLGGVGVPQAQVRATRLASRLAEITGGEPLFLAAPGIVASVEARDALLADPYLAQVAKSWAQLTTVLVGIGSLKPSPLLAESGNAIGAADQDELRALGAVGDVCLHYFDAAGAPVASGLDNRVLGIPADALRAVPRRIGVAGGLHKLAAIRAAVTGGWINVLITDSNVAQALLN